MHSTPPISPSYIRARRKCLLSPPYSLQIWRGLQRRLTIIQHKNGLLHQGMVTSCNSPLYAQCDSLLIRAEPLLIDLIVLAVIMQLFECCIDLLLKLGVVLRHSDAIVLSREAVCECLHTGCL